MSGRPGERIPRKRRRLRWIVVAGVLTVVAIAALVYTAMLLEVWAAEPASMAVGGMSTVNRLRLPFPSLSPVTFANTSSSGAEIDLAVVWPIGLPGQNRSSSVLYGQDARLVIVSAEAGGFSSPRYAITHPRLDSTCLVNDSSTCQVMVDDFGGQLMDNATVLWFNWLWDFGPGPPAPGQIISLAVQYNLTVSPEILSGPTTTSLPSVTFSVQAVYTGTS